MSQWISEGKLVEYDVLKKVVMNLRASRRFNHALQICNWINSWKLFYISRGDVAIQLDLVSKAHGLEAAEKPSFVQEMEDKGISGDAFTYAIRLNAYASVTDIKETEKHLMKMEED
ncbi:hypothetical protein RND71_004696 [Anisodus tanguticus]|uniref:Pentatricopeptide repeat-containing protein n=1 Tax=Anisodus tanguticus TaxID=243964 RepID=A0AAE1VUH1_9SOLA|nr:hypothetical protein RND71_004696 [Anisodus tanguticus]